MGGDFMNTRRIKNDANSGGDSGGGFTLYISAQSRACSIQEGSKPSESQTIKLC